MLFTLENFWSQVLCVEKFSTSSMVSGWLAVGSPLELFSEAPLTKSSELSAQDDPRNSKIILVSAPGAVGKSTLAKQISACTAAIYVDLAQAEPVGGNAISGGLVKSGLYSKWVEGRTALLIDGLDEARIRVTQEAFEAFLKDVADISQGRNLPTVLFGRTGSVQDSWLVLDDLEISKAVLEIGYYSTAQAIDFASARIAHKRNNDAFAAADRQAVTVLLEKLKLQASRDGDRFAGYAPVLQAVADRICAETNPAALVAEIKKGAQPITLQTVADDILKRERSKLARLTFEEVGVSNRLYHKEEQIERLIAKIFLLPPPPLPTLSAADSQTYSAALDTWVDEHPFLNGASRPSSAVFDAVLSVHALSAENAKSAALNRELARGSAANPFFAEFYLPSNVYLDRTVHQDAVETVKIASEHVGIVYSSIRARLTLADSASLVIESDEDDDNHNAEVEIVLDRKGDEGQRSISFDTEVDGTFKLGSYVEDVNLSVPRATVEIGNGSELLLVAPINIQCEILDISAKRLFVEQQKNVVSSAVFLEAEHCETSALSGVPILRGGAKLTAAWPNVLAYPWTNFAGHKAPIQDPLLGEALRRFRKFVIAFRSHSKGALRRLRFKLEHARMTKGSGAKVLQALKDEGIITLHGNMYELNAKSLGEVSGATYAQCMACEYEAKTVNFIEKAIKV